MLGRMFSMILPFGEAYAKIKAEEKIAIATAQAQAKLNYYKTNDPSIGPNDPNAAQVVANKTLAQTYLPAYMLFTPTTDAKGAPTGGVQITPLGYVVIFTVGIMLFLLFRRK